MGSEENSAPKKSGKKKWVFLIILVVLVVGLFICAPPNLFDQNSGKRNYSEVTTWGALQKIHQMMSTFHKKGYAGNRKIYPVGHNPDGRNSGKLCGLYYEVNNAEDPVTLIEEKIANADFRSGSGKSGSYTPVTKIEKLIELDAVTFTREPHAGYWFALMEYASPDQPYDKEYAREHFAIVAFPEQYNHFGRRTFIMNETGVIYAKDRGKEDVGYLNTWPVDPEMNGWINQEMYSSE